MTKILIINKKLLPIILESIPAYALISKTTSPVEKQIYNFDGNVLELTIHDTINDKSLRGKSPDIIYMTPDDYYQYQKHVLPLLIHNTKTEIRLRIV